MAGKRSATSDLNQDNWNEIELAEDSGTFQRASEDSIKARVIKTAKRRNPISSVRESGDDNAKKSAFTSFTGFGTAPTPTSSSFSFLSTLTTPKTPPKLNGTDQKKETSGFTFNSNTTSKTTNEPEKSTEKMLSWTQSEKTTSSIFTLNKNNNPPTNASPEKSNDYYSKLKGLNQSVSNWIKKHVDANPLINLQPIFKDYEKYFSDLEKERDSTPGTSTSLSENNKTIEVSSISTFKFKPTTSKTESNKKESVSSVSSFTFKPTATVPDSTSEKPLVDSKKTESEKATNIPKFSFGTSVTTAGAVSTTPSFSFGTKSATGSFSFGDTSTTKNDAIKTTSTTSFTFGVKPASASTTLPTFSTTTPFSSATPFSNSTPFSFTNVAKPSAEDQNKETEEDHEPPKNEFTPVVEEDHVYTVRCKVFIKKDDKFGDRGVGNLFLKPIKDSEKFQLIVRADTNLGNLLLNFILSESIPLKRLGNKDVMLACVPSPDVAPPPVPVLLRLKSAEEADKLLDILEKHKK